MPGPCLGHASLLFLLMASPAFDGEGFLSHPAVVAHRAGVQSIQDISCEIKIEELKGSGFQLTRRATYMRSGDKIKIVTPERSDGYSECLTVNNSEIISFGKYSRASKNPGVMGASRLPATRLRSSCDVWEFMVLSFPTKDMYFRTLDDVLQEPNLKCAISKEGRGDSARTDVELTFNGMSNEVNRVHIFLDPRYNYLCSEQKWITESKLGKSTGITRITRFEEVQPGVFIPLESETDYSDSFHTSKVRAHLEQLQVNSGIPADAFQQRLPAGIRMMDSIDGKIYHIDAMGRRYGSEDPLRPNPPDTRERTFTFGRQSTEEASSSMYWLLPVSLCGLSAVIFVRILIMRHRRKAGTSPT